MLSFLIRRLNLLLITAFILTIIAFMIDRTVSINHTTEKLAQGNFVLQYFSYLWQILSGNFGYSTIDQQGLLKRGLIFFASTLELCFLALLFSSLMAIPLGLLAGLFRNTKLDYIIMTIAIIGLALPVFWVGVMAV